MVNKKSWEEFRESGLLWFINTILHMFGWAIVVTVNENESITNVYPARTSFRGFSEDVTSDGYAKVTKYLKDNIKELYKEVQE